EPSVLLQFSTGATSPSFAGTLPCRVRSTLAAGLLPGNARLARTSPALAVAVAPVSVAVVAADSCKLSLATLSECQEPNALAGRSAAGRGPSRDGRSRSGQPSGAGAAPQDAARPRPIPPRTVAPRPCARRARARPRACARSAAGAN